MDRASGSAYRYAPDGLVGKALEDPIARAYAEVVHAPVPTSALLDGRAGEQRPCRMERRTVAAGCVLLVDRGRIAWMSPAASLSDLAHVGDVVTRSRSRSTTPDPAARTAKNVPAGSGLLNHSPKQSRRSE